MTDLTMNLKLYTNTATNIYECKWIQMRKNINWANQRLICKSITLTNSNILQIDLNTIQTKPTIDTSMT